MSLETTAAEQYVEQQRIILATLLATRRAWARMGPDFDASWQTVGPQVTVLTTAAQLAAARSAAAFVPHALEVAGTPVDPVGEVVPKAFSGVASDGRPLDSLLYGAVTTAKQRMAIDIQIDGFRAHVSGGSTIDEALAAGGKWLDMAVHTQVADASRGAAGLAIFARPQVGWIRRINPPCCADCALLNGKWFKSNQGFARHPHCDCAHWPMMEDGPSPDSRSLDEMVADGSITGMSKVERQAVTDGADFGQIINGRRGRSADKLYTSEGTTRRGVGSKMIRATHEARGAAARETATNVGKRGAVKNYVVRRVRRPTPEAIYRFSDSREEAIRLLRENGYMGLPIPH